MKKSYLVYAAIIAVILSGCKGKDGAPGATGPQGNANVIGYNYTSSTWQENSDNTLWYANFSVPALTSSVLSGGATQVYFSFDNGTTWNAMPDVAVASIDYFWEYYCSVGNVTIDWVYNGSGAGDSPSSVYQTNNIIFKIVCIAPSGMKKYSGTNWKDYNQVNKIMQSEKINP